MSEFFIAYALVTMAKVSAFFCVVAVVMLVVAVVATITAPLYLDLLDNNDRQKIFRAAKWFCVVFAIASTIYIVVPDKERLKWIIGGGIALKAAQNEELQKLPTNVLSVVNEWLEEQTTKDGKDEAPDE